MHRKRRSARIARDAKRQQEENLAQYNAYIEQRDADDAARRARIGAEAPTTETREKDPAR